MHSVALFEMNALVSSGTPDRLFALAGDIVLPVWLLLLIVPRWQVTAWLATFIVPLLLASVYLALLLTTHPAKGAGFGSLNGVAALFSDRHLLLAGWLHYLAFDLFTGAWETRDALRLGISRWLLAPALVLTFFFGPVGLGFYLLLRLALRRRAGVLLSERSSKVPA